MKKVFIGNIPFSAQEIQLQDWFHSGGIQPAGVAIVRHKVTGNSRGFGFADFDDVSLAERAVAELNGGEFQGRRLMLSIARSDGPAIQASSDK
ncbi:MAG: RNA-binding protein [Acidobacteria bacterium]|nr:RNA-binding protein [Acidobacteriota bacterium]